MEAKYKQPLKSDGDYLELLHPFIIRFIYYIYNYRLLYYLPMERMSEEEFINNVERHITSLKNLDNKALKILVGKLEQENKNLRAYADNLDSENDNQAIEIEELKKENKKLNIKVASLEWEIKWLNYTIEKLKEENQTLELWLDNKEKLNEKYRKEIDNKKLSTIAEETISDLQARIKELKDRIDVLYEFIERNDKLVDEVIAEEDLDKLNRYICIDDDLVDRTLESED